MNLFRNLTKEEVEVRRGRKVGDSGKVELLIYKTARTDMNLLDETFGNFGWAVQYKEEKGILFCGLGIYDKEQKLWVWRWNAGAEGNFEAEKSVASDSMKRAGFLFGLGRELYTAPRIIVTPKNEYTQFYVDEISYDEKDRIDSLVIVDDEDNIVFRMVNGNIIPYKQPEVDRTEVLRIFCSEQKKAEGVDTKSLLKFWNYYKDRVDKFDSFNAKIAAKLWGKWNSK